MTRSELINYIRNDESSFEGMALESHSLQKLTLMKICIDARKEMDKIKDSSSDILSVRLSKKNRFSKPVIK